MTDKTGGPAFPTRDNDLGYYGMTLRDYFAAKAMQGMLSVPDVILKMNNPALADSLAKASYEWADAMLEAREK